LPGGYDSHFSSDSHFLVLKSLSFSPLVVAVCQSHAGHALAQAALFHKLLLQGLKLLIDEEIGLMEQANRDVGDDLRRPRFHELPV
jgi:hypothetical protein